MSKVETRRNGFTFDFDGSEETKANIVALLVRAGIRVTGVVEKQGDLEDILLQVGASKVQ